MPSSARRFDNWAVRLYQPVPPVRSRGDVGIAPYADREMVRFITAANRLLAGSLCGIFYSTVVTSVTVLAMVLNTL